MAHKYTAEHLAWLKAHRPKLQIKALASIFNARFGTQARLYYKGTRRSFA